jgi:sugar phosphate isomerase/epimerase
MYIDQFKFWNMESRRRFLRNSGVLALGGLFLQKTGLGANPALRNFNTDNEIAGKFDFEISLAEFSFAGQLMSGKMSNMDFPARAKNEFGINVLEYVSGFFNEKHTDSTYIKELKKRCDDLGMKNHLIMVDGANIADLDPAKRKQAVESHYAWVDAAKLLGCSSIRVNLGDTSKAITGVADDPPGEAAMAAAEGYRMLLEYAAKQNMNVIVENHFGNSTDIDWLVGVIKTVNMSNAGLLPDLGNFCRQRSTPETNDLKGMLSTKCLQEYDRYEGVRKMMPYAKGISAKSHKFDADGNETEIDYFKIFSIIKEAGFTGYVGIEYEGGLYNLYDPSSGYMSDNDGIKATKALLERVREELA